MSDFHCCCGNTEGESPDLYNESFPIAKKEHKCIECSATIMPGEKYHYVKGRWDFGWDVYKTCYQCFRIREDYCECGYIFGGLQKAIWECLGFNYVTNEMDDEEDMWEEAHG